VATYARSATPDLLGLCRLPKFHNFVPDLQVQLCGNRRNQWASMFQSRRGIVDVDLTALLAALHDCLVQALA
jgi:hypothetical protein